MPFLAAHPPAAHSTLAWPRKQVRTRAPAALARASLLVVLLAGLGLAGCSLVPERAPVPQDLAEQAEVPGIPRARIWGDAPPPWIGDLAKADDAELRARFADSFGKPHHYLAISGGGPDGAYGAGLLNGWSKRGDRPEFNIVTGISTGALAAPFAFLGPDYDHVLTQVYTENSTKDLVERRSWIRILVSDSAADTRLLRAKIAHYVTPEVIERIAAAHKAGRRLYIGTVNLDLARPVIWDIGAIAASGAPKAPDLIRDLMLASASIPGAFPPVFIPVEAGGRRYDEMHVDGGTATQVFLYPVGLDWRKITKRLQVPGKPHAYVIRNSKLQADWEGVQPWLPRIAGRSVSSLIRTQGIGDIFRMYIAARRDGLDFNLAFIPDDFDLTPNEPFDPVYMRALYELGRGRALEGYPWAKAPPGM